MIIFLAQIWNIYVKWIIYQEKRKKAIIGLKQALNVKIINNN